MTVHRWRIVDPFDSNTETKTYFFPRNPASMTSPYPERPLNSMATTRGAMLFTEGAPAAKQWQFSGPLLHKDELDAFTNWVYEKPGRVVIQDHLGRKLNCMLTSVDLVPKRRIGYYYSHDYTVTALVFGITPPDEPDTGPTP